MPISDDEFDGYHQDPAHPGMSKAEQRRSNKPIMEKRRRARINHCLNELKALILDAMNKDPARHSKLEKADILEMTVKHLQTIQRQQLDLAVSADPSVVHKFKTGFHECAGEVGRYIGRMEGVEVGVKQRLVNHLASCVQQITPFTLPAPNAPAACQGSPDDVNNNSASARLQMMTGLQLIPSRLPSGELALLLPNSQNLPFFPPPLDNQVSTTTESPVVAHFIDRSRNSAFTAVSKDKPLERSPLPSPTSTTLSSYDDDSCDGAFLSSEVTSTSEHMRTTQDSGVPFQTDQNKNTDSHKLLTLYHNGLSDPTKDSRPNISTSRFTNHVKALKPLTVITSNDILKDHPQRFLEKQQTNFKDPLDFSVKKDPIPISCSLPLKRPFQDDSLDKLLMKSPQLFQAPQKIPRLYVDSHLQNKVERRSLHEIQIQKHPSQSQIQLNQQPERQSLLEIQNQPSTSSSEVPRDMWRPW